MNCKDCKHWEVIINNESSSYMTTVDKDGNYGECIKEGDMGISTHETSGGVNKMIPISEWGDASWIITGKDFGCIHFEEKLKE